MHGIVHRTLEEFVVETTGDDTWHAIVDRTAIEPTLYLPVSSYDDREIEIVLEALAARTSRDRSAIEREFGRTLAPELLSTFGAHVPDGWDLFALLENVDSVVAGVGARSTATTPPAVSATCESADRLEVCYRIRRNQAYCGLAHGILEGFADAFDEDVTVTKRDCVHEGDEVCVFGVERSTRR